MGMNKALLDGISQGDYAAIENEIFLVNLFELIFKVVHLSITYFV